MAENAEENAAESTPDAPPPGKARVVLKYVLLGLVVAACLLVLYFQSFLLSLSAFYEVSQSLLSGVSNGFGDVNAAYWVDVSIGDFKHKGDVFITQKDGMLRLCVTGEPYQFRIEQEADGLRWIIGNKKVSIEAEDRTPGQGAISLDGLLKHCLSHVPDYRRHLSRDAASGAMKLAVLCTHAFSLSERKEEGGRQLYYLDMRQEADFGTGRVVIDSTKSTIEQIRWASADGSQRLRLNRTGRKAPPADELPAEGWRTIKVPYDELYRTLALGPPRAVQVFAEMEEPPEPSREPREYEGGRLLWHEGNRVLLLQGDHEQMGRQQGALCADEVRYLVELVLYGIGLVKTYQTGEWHLDSMKDAYRRTAPYVPKRFKEELAGLAEGAGVRLEDVELASIFPELFHCSGFALWGKATEGGTLYHGRVLDYGVEYGLQWRAAVIVCTPSGYLPFVNVGYCGFTGSVTGMNDKQIAIGEMGGRGEGDWDGIPMGFLVRDALERAKTLDEAMQIFRETPRTCEYYYVISDGKIPNAWGLKTTPKEFVAIGPNEFHELLPHPVEDAVLLSAGDRYKELVKRVKENHGKIDSEKAIWLMSRPVAMKSNLHDALFAPQTLEFWVANAGAGVPACNNKYFHYRLDELLSQMK